MRVDELHDLLRRLQRALVPVEPTIKPWPRWVRYPVIAAFAAVVVYGLVSLAGTGLDRAALAGLRVAVSLGVAGLTVMLIRIVVDSRRARRNWPARPASVRRMTDADRDRVLSQEMDRRLAQSRTSVRDTYAEARDLSAALRDAGLPEWSRRIDDTLVGGTANEILMALSWTLSDLVSPSWDDESPPAPDLPGDLRDRVLSLRSEIGLLLGM